MTATARTAPAILGPGRRLRRRHLWLVPGIGVALFANVQANAFGLGLAPLLIFGIVPHLTVLVGFGQPHGRGQLDPIGSCQALAVQLGSKSCPLRQTPQTMLSALRMQ
jgi:hypothetical protein